MVATRVLLEDALVRQVPECFEPPLPWVLVLDQGPVAIGMDEETNDPIYSDLLIQERLRCVFRFDSGYEIAITCHDEMARNAPQETAKTLCDRVAQAS